MTRPCLVYSEIWTRSIPSVWVEPEITLAKAMVSMERGSWNIESIQNSLPKQFSHWEFTPQAYSCNPNTLNTWSSIESLVIAKGSHILPLVLFINHYFPIALSDRKGIWVAWRFYEVSGIRTFRFLKKIN